MFCKQLSQLKKIVQLAPLVPHITVHLGDVALMHTVVQLTPSRN